MNHAPYTIIQRNPDQGLAEGLHYLLRSGIRMSSRNGPVLAAPGVVVVHTPNVLTGHVSLSPLRDANPFFHIMETLWMLTGQNDATLLTPYVARMTDFADDGRHLHGAYGWRWRQRFGVDQLNVLAAELRSNPNTRRAVLQMWAADGDLVCSEGGAGGPSSKDLPCNTECVFRVIDRVLHMTVHNRSNDAVWGCHGANVVHFSGLLMYMAAVTGLQVGSMTQVSTNYHIYVERPDVQKLLANLDELGSNCAGSLGTCSISMLSSEDWKKHAVKLLNYSQLAEESTYCDYTYTASVLSHAHKLHRESVTDIAILYVRDNLSTRNPWNAAAVYWLRRRLK